MDKSRVEPTIFFIEKISFSLKLFYGHFYGQSFIKTVRGPLSDDNACFVYIYHIKNRNIGGKGGPRFESFRHKEYVYEYMYICIYLLIIIYS